MMFLRQKFVRIGVLASLVVLMIFGLAMMGSVLGAKPKELPLGIVAADRPVDLPTGGQLALGQMVQQKVTENALLPVKWTVYGSEEDAVAAMDRQEAYGVIVIPSDFSAGVLSIQSGQPKPGNVKLYVNEGMNAQGVAAAKTILQQISQNVRSELTRQVLDQLGQRTQQIPVAAAQGLMTPFTTQEVVVHPVGSNNGGGGAPNMLTQIMWMGSLIISLFLFFAGKAAGVQGGSRRTIVSTQLVLGLVLTAGASAFLVWMAHSWYGMQLANVSATWLFVWLTAAVFFLMQTALFNWLGMPAIALLVLLLFFSMPILAMAPEFMPQVTQDWLYSWTPFRYVASGLRNVMYFGGTEGMGLAYGVLWGIAGVSAVLVLASGLRKGRDAVPASDGTPVLASE